MTFAAAARCCLVAVLSFGAGPAAASSPEPLAAEGTLAAGPLYNIDARSITTAGIFTGLALHDDATGRTIALDPDLVADERGTLTGVVVATEMLADGTTRSVDIPVEGRLRLNETIVVRLGAATPGGTTSAWSHALAARGLAEVGPEDWTLEFHGRSRGRLTGGTTPEPLWQWQLALTSTAGWQATGAATLTLDAGTPAGFYATPEQWSPRTPDLSDWQGDALLVAGEHTRDGGRTRLTLSFADAETGRFELRAALGTTRVRQTGASSTTEADARRAWSDLQLGPGVFDLLPSRVLFTTPGSSTRTVLEWDEAWR